MRIAFLGLNFLIIASEVSKLKCEGWKLYHKQSITKYFKNLQYLILDCLWYNFHPSHFNLDTSLAIIKKFKPKKAILTNLSPVLDYKVLKKIIPKNVIPAHDGLTINL